MSAIDWNDFVNFGVGLYNYDEIGDSFDAARSDIDTAFNNANQYTQDYLDPLVGYGQWGMEGVQGLGEFDFDFDNYLGSEAYNWLIDEGLRGVQRTQAANKMLQSSNTLAALNERNMMLAQNLYGEEHARQLAEWNANLGMYEGAVGVGAEAASDAAQTLGDLAIGYGGTMAGLEIGEAEANAAALAAIMSPMGGGGGSSSGGTGSTGGGLGTQDADGNYENGIGGSNVVDPTGGIFSGGGTDGEGQWGLAGDLGALAIGKYGQDVDWVDFFGGEDEVLPGLYDLVGNISPEELAALDYDGSWYEGLSALASIDQSDVDQLVEILSAPEGTYDFGAGSWFEGLDQVGTPEEIQALMNDDSFWTSVSNGLTSIWDNTIGAAWDGFIGLFQ